jgi:hypothetical protein
MLVLEGGKGSVDPVLFAADGGSVYAVDGRQTLRAWRLPATTPTWSDRPDNPYIRRTAVVHPVSGFLYRTAWYGLDRVNPDDGRAERVRRGPLLPGTVAACGAAVLDLESGWEPPARRPVCRARWWADDGTPAATEAVEVAGTPWLLAPAVWHDPPRFALPVTRGTWPDERTELCVWGRRGGRPSAKVAMPNRQLVALAADPTGPAVFAASGPTLFRFDFKAPDARPLRATTGNRKHLTGLAVHPNARLVLAAANDHTVRGFDADTLAPRRTWDWHAGRLRSVAVSADGTLAAAGTDDGRVVVWDLDV